MLRIVLFLSLLSLSPAPALAQLVIPESEGMSVPPGAGGQAAVETPGSTPAEADAQVVEPPKSIPEGPEMGAWAGKAVCKALTLNFKSYSVELKKASKNFSHPGWKQFTSDLLSSRMIEDMNAKQQNMNPEPCAEPTLVQITEDGGQKKWHYTMPLQLQLVGEEIGLTAERHASFTVERALSHSDGLNITSWDWVEKK